MSAQLLALRSTLTREVKVREGLHIFHHPDGRLVNEGRISGLQIAIEEIDAMLGSRL